LIANAPESADSSFTWEHFAATVNKDLADVLGNFVNRVTKFCAARFEGKVPSGGEDGPEETALIADLDARIAQYTNYMEGMEFRKALSELRAIWVACNEYVTRAAPWTAIKTDPAKAAVSVRMGLNLARLCAHLSWPVIPGAAARIYEALEPAPAIIPFPDGKIAEFFAELVVGAPVTVPELLFAKIEDEKIKEWEQRFGGGS